MTQNILETILAHKRGEVAKARARMPEHVVREQALAAAPVRGFARALTRGMTGGAAVIAEVKRASPSRGLLKAHFDPVELAQAYARGGASALSVLTDEKFFQGHLEHLVAARAATLLPVLRKDFVIDGYQIEEARAHGADCILLIVAALAAEALRELAAHAMALGMDVLVEVHDEAELALALTTAAPLIGINNRDLRTFVTDLSVTARLAPSVPADRLVVCESGIHQAADVSRIKAAGVRAFLVGESLIVSADAEAALRALLQG